jgi:hypothetical protein
MLCSLLIHEALLTVSNIFARPEIIKHTLFFISKSYHHGSGGIVIY